MKCLACELVSNDEDRCEHCGSLGEELGQMDSDELVDEVIKLRAVCRRYKKGLIDILAVGDDTATDIVRKALDD